MSCTFYVPDQILVDDLSREVVEQFVIGPENFEYLVTLTLRIYLSITYLFLVRANSRKFHQEKMQVDTVPINTDAPLTRTG